MMHPDFRTLLAAYTPDELATIFREELEALRIPYTIKHPTHFQFTPLSSDDFDSGIVSLNWKANSYTPKSVFPYWLVAPPHADFPAWLRAKFTKWIIF